MLEIVETTLFYLIDRPVVHSEVSGLPYMVSFFVSGAFIQITPAIDLVLQFERPFLLAEDALQRYPAQGLFWCLRESNQNFIDRSGWIYSPSSSPINVPFPDIQILPA